MNSKNISILPFELVHQEVRIRASERLIEIFHPRQPQAIIDHPRSRTLGRYSTQTAHMPAQHQSASEWTPERLLHWADEIGPHTQQLLHSIHASRQHPEQAFHSCLGILHLSHQYTHAQRETACQLAQ